MSMAVKEWKQGITPGGLAGAKMEKTNVVREHFRIS
jgi:hypothetical protein